MKREHLEHLIRASAAITGTNEFIVIGSQAVLGQFPDAPSSLLVSMEADLFSLENPRASDLIDGSIGEASPFHQTFGYFAHGVGPETATLPNGWQSRLVSIHSTNTGGGTGRCLEVHDLAVSKLIAGREKDLEFVRELVQSRLADSNIIRERLSGTRISSAQYDLAVSRLARL